MEKLKQIIEDFKFLTFGINEHCLEDYLSEHTIEILANHLIEKGYTKQEWISVEERLPNNYEEVLCYLSDMEFLIITYTNYGIWKNGWVEGDTDDFRITHWMPLPTPPQMKGAE